MTPDQRQALAIRMMDDFADRTGLSSDRPPTRYLWTDAFAVCNYLGLFTETGEDRFLELARTLVDQVHRTLGRHRTDDPRRGWISGLPEVEGAEHPTAGGLRIGKPRNERAPDDPYISAEEWDRDGQYYHYLTRWVFALSRLGRVTGAGIYHRWAVELAEVMHSGFLIPAAGGHRLCWKMSIDLSRPLVASAGHHDPLDGLVVTSVLETLRPKETDRSVAPTVLQELSSLCKGASWVTNDPLGVGGLLVDTLRCGQLAVLGHPTGVGWFGPLLRDSLSSLQQLADAPFLRQPADRRLAFRELGLALGLQAVGRIQESAFARVDPSVTVHELNAMQRFRPIGRAILDFWAQPRSRAGQGWFEHRDISDVMWATCLEPAGLLDL